MSDVIATPDRLALERSLINALNEKHALIQAYKELQSELAALRAAAEVPAASARERASMSDPFLTGLGASQVGAAAGAQEPSWALARSTVAQPGLHRDEVAVVDLNDPVIRAKLTHERITFLPAADQPVIRTDPATGQPTLADEETT